MRSVPWILQETCSTGTPPPGTPPKPTVPNSPASHARRTASLLRRNSSVHAGPTNHHHAQDDSVRGWCQPPRQLRSPASPKGPKDRLNGCVSVFRTHFTSQLPRPNVHRFVPAFHPVFTCFSWFFHVLSAGFSRPFKLPAPVLLKHRLNCCVTNELVKLVR